MAADLLRVIKLYGSQDDWQRTVTAGQAHAAFASRYHVLTRQIDLYLRCWCEITRILSSCGPRSRTCWRRARGRGELHQRRQSGLVRTGQTRAPAGSPRPAVRLTMDQVTRQLGADSSETLRGLLQRRGPRSFGNTRRVLWLDWGTWDLDAERRFPKGKHLEAWVYFASQVLAPACADNLRIN